MTFRTEKNLLALLGVGVIAFRFGVAYVIFHFVSKFW